MPEPQTQDPTQTPLPSAPTSPVKKPKVKKGPEFPPAQAILSDPSFQALPFNERITVLQRVDPNFAALPRAEQLRAMQRLNPDFVAQSKMNPFAMTFKSEHPDIDTSSVWGVTKWIMKQSGAGVLDAWKGALDLLYTSMGGHKGEKGGAYGESGDPARQVGHMTLGALWEQLRQTPEAIEAVKELAHSKYGGVAVATEIPRAVGQYVGAETVGKVAGKVAKLPETAAKIKEGGIQAGVQEYVAGSGKNLAEELATKQREAFSGSMEQVRAKNAALKQEYDAAVKTATEERIQAEERYKVEVDKAKKEHEAARVEELKKHEAKIKEQQADYEKKVAQQTEDYQKKLDRQARAHAKLQERVKRENAAKLKEHEEATKRVDELNKAEQEKVGRRAELATKVKNDSVTLGGQLKKFYKDAKAYGKSLYAPVDEATEGMSIPVSELANDVEHAQTNILMGSEESIKQFNDILRRSESEGPELAEDAADPRGFSYQEKLAAGEPITFRDLQGYYSEIGKKLFGPGSGEMLGDVRTALRYVYGQIGKKMMKMAREAEVGDELKAAMDFHSELQAAFNDMSPIKTARSIGQRAGSPVARAIRAQDPQYIRDPFLNPAYGERALSLIKGFEKYGELKAGATQLGKTVEQIGKDYGEFKSLPKTAKVTEAPAAPKLKEAPEPHEPPEKPRPVEPPKVEPAPEAKPFEKPKFSPPEKVVPPDIPNFEKMPEPMTTEQLAADLKKSKTERVRARSREFTQMNKWDAIALGYGVKELISGEWPKAWAYILGHYGMGKLMKLPRMNAWLTEVTDADIAILEKTYAGNPGGKAMAQQGIVDAIKGNKLKPSPSAIRSLAKFLTKPQVQAVIKAGGKIAGATQAEHGKTMKKEMDEKTKKELQEEIKRDEAEGNVPEKE